MTEAWRHKIIPCCPDCGRRMRKASWNATSGTCRIDHPERARPPRWVPRPPGQHDEIDWSTRTNQEAA